MNSWSEPENGQSVDETGSSHERECPRCGESLYRIPRRDIDLLMSMFVSVRRYRCESVDCGWEGTIRDTKHPLKKRIHIEPSSRKDSIGESQDISSARINDIPIDLPVATDNPTTILLVENNPSEARLILETLGSAGESPFRVEWVTQLSDALERLGRGGIEIVLLGLVLPDDLGSEAFNQLSRAAPNSPILVLGSRRDEEISPQEVHHGEQALSDKDPLDKHPLLTRILQFILEIRQKNPNPALSDTETIFRAMSDSSPLGIFVSDKQGRCIYTNAAYLGLSGLTSEQTLGTNWSMSIHPEDRQKALSEWKNAMKGDEKLKSEFRFLRKDGSVVWTRLNRAPLAAIPAHDGKNVLGHVQTVEDITERKSAELLLQGLEERLFEEKERAKVTLDSIGDAVLTTGLTNNVTYMNVVAEAMTGWSREDALNRPLQEVFNIIDGTTRQAATNPAQRAIDENRTINLGTNCVLIHRDGSESAIEDSTAPIHNRDGQVSGAVIVFHDVSELRGITLKMSRLAHHDFLTGLPNRMLLTERLSQAIVRARRNQKQVALLFLDLDHFKNINDSLGHAIGDQLLRSVADRLSECVRTTDTVSRQGGDEFVILLAEIEHPQDAAQVAGRLITAFSEPHFIGIHEYHATLSIGISIYPDDDTNVDIILQNADTAMYHAKSSGRNNYQFFRADMNSRAVRRLSIESSLYRALKQGEFLLYYQPKIDLASDSMTGAEALIRWQNPDLGLVYPGDFVPIAEECGLIVPIGQWVLRQACLQTRIWLDAGLSAVPVSVNISPSEFRHKNFLDSVLKTLKETGLPPHYLELELTEGILMHDTRDSLLALKTLKTMGVKLAIDDFGTGYSSLSYLKRFPIHTLKIDQSFVRDIATDEDDATIISAVIGMGRNLKHQVIAEGVETREQLAFLRTQRCDGGQGFYFSYPLSAEDFEVLLLTGKDDLTKSGLD